MMEYLLTIFSVPGVIALVNLAKKFGVKGRWAQLAAVIIGALLGLLSTWAVAEVAIGARELINGAAQGIIIGLSAAGIYDLTN